MIASLFDSVATFKRGTLEKVAFLLLAQVDLALTAYAISQGFVELNPLVRYLATVPVLLVVIKSVIPLLIAWLIPGRLLIPAAILLLYVVMWNVKELMLVLF